MRQLFPAIGLVALAACSGGGSPTPTPTPTSPPGSTNRAPFFDSKDTVSIIENRELAYLAVARDPDGDPITFSVTGGTDGALFTTKAPNEILFVTPPNFERPSDANGDNVYEVQVSVSDGKVATPINLKVTVQNSGEGFYVTRLLGANQPVQVAAYPERSDRTFIIEKGGRVLQNTSVGTSRGTQTLFTVGDISTDGERGLLGITASDDFATTNALFVLATAVNGDIQLRQYRIGNPTFNGSGYRVEFTIPHPNFNNHNGGWLGFGPDGYLYLAIGDGGGVGDPGNNAQNPNSRLGKILRLARNPAGTPPYWLPAPGNPFIGGGGDPHVFALGLRNPFRASFHQNRLFIGDVGQDRAEEINLMPLDRPGMNFGWPFKEGTLAYRGTAPAGLIDPVIEYRHGSGPYEGGSVVGGFVYEEMEPAGPREIYVFGDFVAGRIWSVRVSAIQLGRTIQSNEFENRMIDFTTNNISINQPVSFGVSSDGTLHVVDFDGDVFRNNRVGGW